LTAELPKCGTAELKAGIGHFWREPLLPQRAPQQTQFDLDVWRVKLAALDGRLGAWQQAMKQEIEREFGRLRQENQLQDPAEQQNAVRVAMARAGEGPRRELNGAIDELCLIYLRGSNADRTTIRQLVQQDAAILNDLWGYLRRAAEEVRAGGSDEWLRMGLAVASIEDLLTDYQDVVEGLSELHEAAVQQGIDVARAFAEVAAMSNDEVHEGREISTRELLTKFDPAKMMAEFRAKAAIWIRAAQAG
jgi:hypothetical protein